MAYGAGLRASEVTHLKIVDVESERMILRVEQGKGRRDGIDKLITQPWSIRPQNAFHAVAQFQDENARDRKIL